MPQLQYSKVNNAIITLTDTDDLTKGKHFKSRFIQPGLAGYPGQFGNALIKKENLDRFVHTLRNKPVTINHRDKITEEDKKGEVFNVWFNPEDGWYWCDGIITDDEAINLINNGWSVSCAYDFTKADNSGGTENNIPYDIEFLDGEFNHLALVDNPRYEGANIVFNSKVENADKWITIKPNGEDAKGKHLLLKDGETPKEAIERTYGKGEKSETKDGEEKKKEKSILDIISERDRQAKELKEKGTLKDIKMPKSFAERQQEDIDKGELVELGKFPTKFTSEYPTGFISEYEEYKPKGKQSNTKDKQFESKGDSKQTTDEHADIKEVLKKVRPDLHFNYNKNSKYPYEIKYRENKRFNLNDIATSSDKKEDIYEYLRQQTKAGSNIEKEITEKIREIKDNQSQNPEKKYNYTLTKREVEDKKMLGGMADTGNYYTNGDFAIDKKYLNIKGQEPTKKEEIEKSLKHILKGNSTDKYTSVKDFEVGELKREYGKPIKVAKYSYYDDKLGYERNIYINKKYNDLFKNFDLKFGGEAEPVFAYKGKDIVGVVMPINAREQSYSKTVNNEMEEELTEDKNQIKLNFKEQAQNSLTDTILNAIAELIIGE